VQREALDPGAQGLGGGLPGPLVVGWRGGLPGKGSGRPCPGGRTASATVMRSGRSSGSCQGGSTPKAARSSWTCCGGCDRRGRGSVCDLRPIHSAPRPITPNLSTRRWEWGQFLVAGITLPLSPTPPGTTGPASARTDRSRTPRPASRTRSCDGNGPPPCCRSAPSVLPFTSPGL
jgi:hypothetical protein